MPFVKYLQDLPWADYGLRALGIALVWIGVWLLTRHLSRVISSLDRHIPGGDIDDREIQALGRLLSYVVILIGAIISLAILDLTKLFYGVLTTAGVITIIIGFAVKDVAANFISGIFLLLDQPFVSGDFIEIGSYSGTVRRISLRSTELVTFEGPVVHIPNNKMATDPTINYSMAAMRLVDVQVSVPQDSDLSQAIQVMRDVAQSESRLEADEDITILVANIGEYGIDLSLKCFAPNDVWVQVQSDLRQRIIDEFRRRGLELSVPVQKTLYSPQATVEDIAAAVRSSSQHPQGGTG